MAQFAGHWYSGRAARLVLVEAGLVTLALWVTGHHAQTYRQLAALVAAAACIPAAIYFADLYDPQVMRNDRSRGAGMLKALGFATLAAAIFGLLGGAGLPRGALVDTIGVASIGVLLSRAALVARVGGESHSRVLIVGTGNRAQEVARLVRTEAFGEYEVAGTLDPAVDLAMPQGHATEGELFRAVSGDGGAPQGPQLVPQQGIFQISPSEQQTSAYLHQGPQQAPPRVSLAPPPEVVSSNSLIVAPGPNPLPSDAIATQQMRVHHSPPHHSQSQLASVVQLPTAAQSVVVPARSLGAAVRQLRVDTVIIASDERRARLPVEELIRLRLDGVTVLPAHRWAERVLRRVPLSLLRPSDLAFGHGLTSPTGQAAKRIFDLLMSGLLLLCAAPVLLVLAALIKLDSKGPVFYWQERIGLGGRPYRIHKLRTMRKDAETKSGPVWAAQRDPRITRIGNFLRKTRLDEIPQVFAVFRGDMSFVGPRPERAFFIEQLKRQIPFFGLREAVKPGITGWAQIRYPYGATVEDSKNKLEFDLYYVEHQSLFLDLAICFHTAKTVLFGRGAR